MTVSDWLDDAYFDLPEQTSLDGGTTSEGALWHAVSPRWGHSMHTMCSYQGMFPAKVAHYFIQRHSAPGEVVLDPFSGRGTVALQARAEGRIPICNDLNPLAFVLSKAKVAPPRWAAVMDLVDELERDYRVRSWGVQGAPEDIRMLFHPNTLGQICYIREFLLRKDLTDLSPTEAMIAGALAGIMHGSHRRDGSSQYLSISMPNTFSMAPAYVAKYIREKELAAPEQNVFERLRDKLARLYLDDVAGPDGIAYNRDAVELMNTGLEPAAVDLLVTSPPYLQVVNYGTSNWIRLWLLGLDEVGRDGGAGRKKLDAQLDHGHTYAAYASFLQSVLLATRRVLKDSGVAVFVIGDVADPGRDPLPLAAKIWDDVGPSTGLRLITMIEDYLPIQNKVSRIWGDTKGQATAKDCALVLACDSGSPHVAGTQVDWQEPYKDGGPDAAHSRTRRVREGS